VSLKRACLGSPRVMLADL